MLVLGLDDANRLALAELRPEMLLLALAVLLDHRVRGVEDRVRRAVVLLERDDPGSPEVALELEDVADVGASEAIDALVRITYHHQVLMNTGEQLQQHVLRVVRVLVLVDEDVAERLGPALAGLREALEHLHGQHEHVVEVDGVEVEQLALVEAVHVGDGLVVEAADAGGVLVGADELVLRVRDLRVDAARCEALGIALELLEARAHEADLIGLVVDREVRLVAEPLGLAAEDPAAGGMEGENPDRARTRPDSRLDPRAHLGRGLVRERDREDLVRLHADLAEQVGDPVGEDARLARARARDHEQRALGGRHRLPLRVVQVGEVRLGRGQRRHPSQASDRPGCGAPGG